MTDRNTAEEVADDMLTDPDKDARSKPPAPPQTIEAETPGTREAPPRDDR